MSTAQPAILVIDDEAPMRKYVGMNLKARGYHVLLAANGAEALELVARTRVDLLLLDIGLPGLDGLSVLSAVRREAAVPVLMVSARAREGDKVRALDLGADDYLTKPFGVDELLARVRALLRRADPAHKRSLPAYRSGALQVDFTARRVTRAAMAAYMRNTRLPSIRTRSPTRRLRSLGLMSSTPDPVSVRMRMRYCATGALLLRST